MQSKENAFDLVRLSAALAVFVSHAFPINGIREPRILYSFTTLGRLGVAIFFGISGFLVMQSWERDPRVSSFLLKRIRRIFPGLIVVVLLLSLVMGSIVTTFSLEQYFSHSQLGVFLRLMLLVGNDRLPGVFENNPFPQSVDGSLWTLKYEFLMYLILAIICFLSRQVSISLIFFWVVLGLLNIALSISTDLGAQLLKIGILGGPIKFIVEFGGLFFSGVVFSLWRNVMPWNLKYFLAAMLALISTCYWGIGGSLSWLLIPYLAICAGKCNYPQLLQLVPNRDISYGTYIYAFPITQLVVMTFGPGRSITEFVGHSFIALFLILICARLSWDFVESPFLRRKRV